MIAHGYKATREAAMAAFAKNLAAGVVLRSGVRFGGTLYLAVWANLIQ